MMSPVIGLKPFAFTLLWAVMASAMLLESDAYRYATIALFCFSLVWCRRHLRLVARDWLAILCWLWAAYALIRFIAGIAIHDERGTSEWLYVFPLFFPGLGVALYCTRRYIFAAATVLVCAGLAGLLVTIDYEALRTGERIYPLFHKNPIHAAIGCGMLFITSVFWVLYAGESGRLKGRRGGAMVALGVATATLSLVAILGAQSKGVWLALLPSAALTVLLALVLYGGRWRLPIVAACLALAAIAVTGARDDILRVAAPTVEATDTMLSRMVLQTDPLDGIRRTVEDPETPESMRERLKLWTNSLDTVASSPWVGWGNLWQREWRQGTYSDTQQQLLHNGYLEILVRHGALGIVVLALFVCVSIRRINHAFSAGVIPASLMGYLYSLGLFFFITVASNSNNRLAIGESYFLMAAAAVFAISLATKSTLSSEDIGDRQAL